MNVVQKRLNYLEQKLAQAEQAQRLNAETIAEQQREIEKLTQQSLDRGCEAVTLDRELGIANLRVIQQQREIDALSKALVKMAESRDEKQREIERLTRVKVAAEKYITGWLIDEASDRELCISDEHFAVVRELRGALEAL